MNNASKALTDAGYIVIGLGVMGAQQVEERGRKARQRVVAVAGCISDRRQAARDSVVAHSRAARTHAEARVRTTVARAQDLGGGVVQKVEPVVGQVQSQLNELPERVVQAMEPVAARVRELGGNAA
jgi:hypothetical protein